MRIWVLRKKEETNWDGTLVSDKIQEDTKLFKTGKTLKYAADFTDNIYVSDYFMWPQIYPHTRHFEPVSKFKPFSYIDLLFINVYLGYLRTKKGRPNDKQIQYMLSKINKKHNILNYGLEQFNGLCGSAGASIANSLNNNPGAFWANNVVNQKIKREISFLYAGHNMLTGQENFGNIFDFIINDTYQIQIPSRPIAGLGGNGLITETEDGKNYEINNNTKNTYVRNINRLKAYDLITLINSNFYFVKSQVDGFQSVIEAGEKYVITKEIKEQLLKDAKEDKYFNVFKKIREQNENSSIYKTLNNIADTAGFKGLNEEDITNVVLNSRKVGDLGEVSATLEELKGFINEEDSDFSDNITQCLLITDLASIAKKRRDIRYFELKNKPNGYDPKEKTAKQKEKLSYPYGGRIYCLDTYLDKTLLNCLNGVYGTNHFMQHSKLDDFGNNIKYDFLLYKVEEEENGNVYEYPYFFESDTDASGSIPGYLTGSFKNELNLSPSVVRQKIFPNRTEADLRANDESKDIYFKNIEINIEGDTPATVKSNIDVKITLELPSLDAIQAIFSAKIKDPYNSGEFKDYKYSITELLSYNVGSKYDGTRAARALNTSYIPKKNRLVLKINPGYVKGKREGTNDDTTKYFFEKDFITNFPNRTKIIEDYFVNSGITLDLILVNYSVTKAFDKNKNDSVTIEYKGFMKSFLNEPFCDVLMDSAGKKTLAELEQATIKDLTENEKYCDIDQVRGRLSKHYDSMNKKRTELVQSNTKTLLTKLLQNNQIYTLTLQNDIIGALKGNIDKKTKKIMDPKKVYDFLHPNVADGIKFAQDVDSSGVVTILDKPKQIQFFYFGDLIDVAMDFIYDEAEFNLNSDGKTPNYRSRKRDQLRDAKGNIKVDGDSTDPEAEPSAVRKKFANFPLKVILPCFYPNVYDSSSDSFNTSKNIEDKISIADIPVSVSFFQKWYEEEITKPGIKIYPLGTFISRALNALVNNVLSDNCYNLGNIQRRYFQVRSDFGAFYKFEDKDLTKTRERFNNNITDFDILQNMKNASFFPNLVSTGAPYIAKRNNLPRNLHCNYLVVYEQHSTFNEIEGINAKYILANGPEGDKELVNYSNASNQKIKNKISGKYYRKDLQIKNIPIFREAKTDIFSQKDNDFTKNITFSKTDLPKATEIRFYNDGLNELSALSAVHDASIECQFIPTMYPGMICWVDPDFVDGPEIYGSIPWTMGMGGFHMITKVSHSFDVDTRKITKAKTTINAKYVSNGAKASETSLAKNCNLEVLGKRREVKEPETGLAKIKGTAEGLYDLAKAGYSKASEDSEAAEKFKALISNPAGGLFLSAVQSFSRLGTSENPPEEGE